MLPVTLFVDDNCDGFFSTEECQEISAEVNHYENLQAMVIEVLKIVQKRKGWVSDADVIHIAKFLKISVSDVEGVATFYNQIFREPVGRHVIRFCDSVVCYITGCRGIQIAFEHALDIKQGETTSDGRFTFLPVCCLGRCDRSPVFMIDEDVYFHILSLNVEQLLEKYP